jgi:hypothetical protein
LNINMYVYRKLVIGINCPITDDIFDIVFINNKFQYLEVRWSFSAILFRIFLKVKVK